jgi:hypothetical protein
VLAKARSRGMREVLTLISFSISGEQDAKPIRLQ